ncbi:MAG: RES family NAD+ phosphorylase [Solirubrobacteraceae bacterium]
MAEPLPVASVPVSGTWLRHVPAGSRPLGRPPTPADGRWQRGSMVEGIYLAADQGTVWAEWYRWLAEHEIEPLRGLPRELWRYRARLVNAADLTDPAALAALSLPTAQPCRETWQDFQAVGEQLHAEGYEGLLYRSAARQDGVCLCVFRASADATASLEPLPPPQLVNRPPILPRGLRT